MRDLTKFRLTAENWNGNQWIEISIVDDSIEVHSSLDSHEHDMPYVESAEQWGGALTTRIGMLISQFLYEVKTGTKNR